MADRTCNPRSTDRPPERRMMVRTLASPLVLLVAILIVLALLVR